MVDYVLLNVEWKNYRKRSAKNSPILLTFAVGLRE